MSASPEARFAFLVHPLTDLHRRVIAARTRRWKLLRGLRDGTDPRDVAMLCRLRLATPQGPVEGVVLSVPMLPDQILQDQESALKGMIRAVAISGGGVDAVGLGSLLAVAAGRGTALQQAIWQPVTTGGAATAWAAAENARSVAEDLGLWPRGPIAVLGFGGAVGAAVAERLLSMGARDLHVDAVGPHLKRAERLGLTAFPEPRLAAASCRVVVGASSTGGILSSSDLERGVVLLDVALPPTLSDHMSAKRHGIDVLAGEALSLPSTYQRDGWGHFYHLLAGYGPRHIFACVVEPLVMALQGRKEPFSQGRRITAESVDAVGRGALAAGFQPVLARGWREIEPGTLS